jgi:hypothetical protein
MGVFDRLKGIKHAQEGVAPIPREELEQRLLALNNGQIPFVVRAGSGGKEGDVVAEWRIVDADWYEIFAKASLKMSHKVYVGLSVKDNEARILEESWEVEWRAGVPTLSISAEAFRGRTFTSKSFGTAYAWRGVNPLDYGQVYDYRFDVSEMKDPIAEIVTSGGWTYRPVTTKRGLGS